MGKTNYSAAPSAAGYLYQARLALALCLRYVNADAGVEVGIERLDDVSFELNGSPLELLQAKHHIDRVADLSDKSADLWKTLRIWSEAVARDPTLPARTRFALVTTGTAPKGQAASLLRPLSAYPPGETRDPKTAAALLEKAAHSGANQELKPAYQAFLSLSVPMRASMLSALEVLDRYDSVIDLGETIERDLRIFAPRGKAAVAREMLEGWWWPRVCAALMATPSAPIAILEVEAKLDDIRELLKRDALAVDFEHAEPSEAEVAGYEGRPFVRQLQAVGVGGNRIEYAKRDYYRAFAQRSKWVREHLVFDGEIAKFELTLVEEWQPRFQQMSDCNNGNDANDSVLRQAGQDLYFWVESEARFPFRAATHRFLTVGSYHILANELRLGWHRDYAILCTNKEP